MNIQTERKRIARIIKSKQSQLFLKELANTLDAMPKKALTWGMLINTSSGLMCSIGVMMKSRRIKHITNGKWLKNTISYENLAKALGISESLLEEIIIVNDEAGPLYEESADRWIRVRQWVSRQIRRVPKSRFS